MSDYTPITDAVREIFSQGRIIGTGDAEAEFDRWFAAELEKARADEREKAAQRVREWWMNGDETQFGLSNEALADDLAAAARGEGTK